MPFCYRGRQSSEVRHPWWICIFGIFVMPSGWIHPWPSVSSLYSTRIRGRLYDFSNRFAHSTVSVIVLEIIRFIPCHFLCVCIAVIQDQTNMYKLRLKLIAYLTDILFMSINGLKQLCVMVTMSLSLACMCFVWEHHLQACQVYIYRVFSPWGV